MQAELFERLKNGDESAYKFLFNTYYPPLTNFANKFLKDVNIAKDVVQNVFIKLYQNRERISIETNAKTYLFKAVYNAALNELKKEVVREDYHLEYLSFQEDSYYNDVLEQTEQEYKIYKAIENLPERCRQIFIMNRLNGKKNQEIATELNLSVRTVETQISIALKSLRQSLIFLFLIFF